LVLAAVAFAQMPSGHTPRILSALALLGLGVGFAGSAALRWRWRLGLSCLGAGVGLATLAWWLVPTTGGLSLWTAQGAASRHVAELETLAPGDTAGFLQGRAAREQLADQFPAFQSRLQQAETDWFARTYLHLKPGDFEAASRARASARSNSFWTLWLRLGEADWARRTAEMAIAEAEPMRQTDPARASARLQATARDLAAFGEYPVEQAKLLRARQWACRSRLEVARQEVRKLLAEDRYQAAADLAERLGEEGGREAQAVGEAAELKRFQESCAFLAELSARAKQPPPK
jgi:hypothetical protein